MKTPILLLLLAVCSAPGADTKSVPHYLWFEAETFGPLSGGNFSFQQDKDRAKGTWSVGGPGVAPEWTMGGESIQRGGTLAVSANQLSGPGVAKLGLPNLGSIKESDSLKWGNNVYQAQRFKCQSRRNSFEPRGN